jgi:hypothetical protein
MNNQMQTYRGWLLIVWAAGSLLACNYSFLNIAESCDGACLQAGDASTESGGSSKDASLAGQGGGISSRGGNDATGGSAGSFSADATAEAPTLSDTRDAPISLDLAKDLPSSSEVALDEAVSFASIDATVDTMGIDLPASVDSDQCPPTSDAPLLFSCVWDDTINIRLTWIESQDMTIHGVVSYTMLSAGLNYCSLFATLSPDAQSDTHTLWVLDNQGKTWYVQYYVQSPHSPWVVGDTVDVRYQVTVSDDGRPRRSLVVSSGGRVVAYQAEALTLEELPPAPVELGRAVSLSSQNCACSDLRYDLVAGSGSMSAVIPYGGSATVDGYRIVHGGYNQACSSNQPDRVSVGMLYRGPRVDAGNAAGGEVGTEAGTSAGLDASADAGRL